MRILLLNPPGSRPYLRDYYCASLAKARYSYPPVDLAYLSGRLAELGDLAVIDAIASNLPAPEVAGRIRAFDPEVIVFLSAGLSFAEDLAFLEPLATPGRLLIGSGDLFRDLGPDLLRLYPILSAVLNDFTAPAIVTYLRGERRTPLPGLVYRDADGRVVVGPDPEESTRTFSIPLPRWDLFPLRDYRFPFVRRQPFGSVLTDFGCPFACSFCPIGTLPWRTRPVPEVLAEVDQLAGLGIREIHFRDQTFGLPPARLRELCEGLQPRGVTWSCFSRVDVLTPEALHTMRLAGCHTVIVGIEAAGEDRRAAVNKPTTDADTRTALAGCRREGIRTVGTFILGLPGDDAAAVERTVRYATSLGLDFASFNLAMPRFGTALRRDRGATAATLTRESLATALADRCGFAPLDQAQAWVRQANRRFYLTPSTLLRHAFSTRSWTDLFRQLTVGWSLFR